MRSQYQKDTAAKIIRAQANVNGKQLLAEEKKDAHDLFLGMKKNHEEKLKTMDNDVEIEELQKAFAISKQENERSAR